MSSSDPGRPATERLFAAALPPDAAVAELRAALAPLHALPGARDLRWTGPEGWHFTLAFYGDVPEDVRPELEARLERAARRTEPFALRVHGAGHFGGRALWAGAAGGLDTLRLLAERAEAAARRAGLPMEEHRRYTPHLTLARSRGAADLRPFAAALAGFDGQRWETAELTLVRSHLPVSGVPGERPRYTAVRAWPLGG
ncbi:MULTISPECIES: RNA 2',3'-cyclic phosphodiesterase [Streptomyces albovinaceus subgroup]|uniref:RNA 2',3'-cyclic phosphodiesterase n=1 Tax=Streptomyces globisporus TaxID=1908 RepID=A0ABM9GQE0_STRGL|nr:MULTISPECIES: RNA 2',3'-cyclic phosphodiesterase [Streptomyces albovinaceus subgroup]WSF77349.1 RNA 2',3'-cyclic phosphodiesterase [Streptomyces globisporus]WSU81793.1 RNA 2',3'-cyclic phosphodiesterase [Streptomyces globisporus]WSV90445.1 RNA 2',3'-cyclic phosphodiesterase [Streptomyces globisporus]CAH9413602.1 2'-5' RNA ligase [Streptomyces globisporus]GGW01751.1 RNA 2',3'-cyclic phosphodiesterase [Streptomyces globisporus]